MPLLCYFVSVNKSVGLKKWILSAIMRQRKRVQKIDAALFYTV